MDLGKIYDLLCGVKPHSNICDSIENELFSLMHSEMEVSGNESLLTGMFSASDVLQKPLYCFTALGMEEQHFLMQVVTLLDADHLLVRLSSLLRNNAPKIQLRWSHVLSLISAIVVCTKGGVSLVRTFIRKILKIIFSGNPRDDDDSGILVDKDKTQNCLINEDIFEVEDNTFSHEYAKLLLCMCLSLARQMSIEDPRLTGLTYGQWWSEIFCCHPSNSEILLTRHNFVQFCDILIDLLPFETNPRFLHVQLSSKPFWSVGQSLTSTGRTKQTAGKDKENILTNNTEVLVGFEEADANIMSNDLDLDTLDNGYLNPCVQRWNDYTEIANGRLAELREYNDAIEQDHIYQPMQLVRSTSEDLLETVLTPGWSDVLKSLDEIVHSNSSPLVDRTQHCKLPLQWNEANLFRPRWFRSTLIPALLHAPEIKSLSEEYEGARLQLVDSLKQAGFSDLLNSAPTSMPNVTKKRQLGVGANPRPAKYAKKSRSAAPNKLDFKSKRLQSKE